MSKNIDQCRGGQIAAGGSHVARYIIFSGPRNIEKNLQIRIILQLITANISDGLTWTETRFNFH